MLPDIPDNDTDVCWAGNCVARSTSLGLCKRHYQLARYHVTEGAEPTGHLWDILGLRLDVFRESGGACLGQGPCEMKICRFHVDDQERQRAPIDASEPCALKLAGNGVMQFDEIADRMGCSRQRAQQIEVSAKRSLRRACERAGISMEDVLGFLEKAA